LCRGWRGYGRGQQQSPKQRAELSHDFRPRARILNVDVFMERLTMEVAR
jgi:hypothetical protein